MEGMVKKLIILMTLVVLVQSMKDLADRRIVAKKDIDPKAIKLLHNTNATLLERCEFFKSFEDRFPCGKDYWIMNWGYKYCRRYANPEFIANFTKVGQELLDAVNKCLPNKFEKFYRRKQIHCKRLHDEAFDEQASCYNDVKEKFCKGFGENKLLFVKVLDYADLMVNKAFQMIKKAASGCKPKIDLLNIL